MLKMMICAWKLMFDDINWKRVSFLSKTDLIKISIGHIYHLNTANKKKMCTLMFTHFQAFTYTKILYCWYLQMLPFLPFYEYGVQSTAFKRDYSNFYWDGIASKRISNNWSWIHKITKQMISLCPAEYITIQFLNSFYSSVSGVVIMCICHSP